MGKSSNEFSGLEPEPIPEPVPDVVPQLTVPDDPRIGTRIVATGEVTRMPDEDYKGRLYSLPVSRYTLPGRKDLFVVAPPHEQLTAEILTSFVPAEG